VIGADVEPADIVAHDDEDVGFSRLRLGLCGAFDPCGIHQEPDNERSKQAE
jgi:hypothetical protein